MKKELDIIDKKNYFLVNHGAIIIILVLMITLMSLFFLKIDEKSILEMIIDFYIKDKGKKLN
tara:strand:+ start:402 stop:587 length:186 start_codon:yes stop_codon:yes gene_type:complete